MTGMARLFLRVLFAAWIPEAVVQEDVAGMILLGVVPCTAIVFGVQSGAALATVADVLVEVPVMLSLVAISKRNRRLFPHAI